MSVKKVRLNCESRKKQQINKNKQVLNAMSVINRTPQRPNYFSILIRRVTQNQID